MHKKAFVKLAFMVIFSKLQHCSETFPNADNLTVPDMEGKKTLRETLSSRVLNASQMGP